MIVDGATPTSIRRYRIILAEPLDLDHTHRLRGPDDAFIARRKWPGIRSWGNIRSWRRKRFCKQDPLPPTIAKIGSLQTPVISTSRELELQYLLCRFSPEFLIWEYRLMSRLQDLRSELLCDGKITENEVGVIRDYIQENGTLDLADVKFLVELLGDARTVSPSFDALFFPVLKDVLLADGKIGPDEQYYLLKMLYADGNVRESEKQFLRELMAETKEVTPELQALCETAFNAPSTNWSVGGK
jgi:hypothetical protein